MHSYRSFSRLFQGDIISMDRFTYDEKLEEVIQLMNVYRGFQMPNKYALWGNALYLPIFLLEEQTANALIIEQIQKHWMEQEKIEQFNYFFGSKITTDDMMTDSIKQNIITFLEENMMIHYDDFLQIVQADVLPSFQIPDLFRIYRIKVGDKVFIQIIEDSNAIMCYALLAKKLYSVFMQVPYSELHQVEQLAQTMEHSMICAYPDGAKRVIYLMNKH